MCIVPKLVDWFIILVLLVLKLFVSSYPYELWRCPMHLCFAIPWGTSWIPLMLCFLYVKQTNVFQSIIHDLLFVLPFMLQHSWYVLLLEIYLSCSCLEYFDLTYQCFTNILIKIVIACHLKNYSFYHLPTRGRAGVNLGDV